MLKSPQFDQWLAPPTLPQWFVAAVLGCGLATTIGITHSPAQSTPIAAVGWEFAGQPNLNLTALLQFNYIGDCAGTETPYQEARFTSSKTPPAPGRRVVIRNVSRGLASDPSPYTDREYTEGRSSEATRVLFGTKHSSKYLNVLVGQNEFVYEIKEQGRVLESGTFSATIAKQETTQPRNAVTKVESVCKNSSVSLDVCADVRTRTQQVCPNGPVLASSLDPDYRETFTVISNQSYQEIVYTLDGEIESLSPGERRRFRSRQALRIGLNPTCPKCQPTEYRTLQEGKRYQFKTKNGAITIADFPKRWNE